jgi:hypothetical protein
MWFAPASTISSAASDASCEDAALSQARHHLANGATLSCCDHHCSQQVDISDDRWAADVGFSGVESGLVCTACSKLARRCSRIFQAPAWRALNDSEKGRQLVQPP